MPPSDRKDKYERQYFHINILNFFKTHNTHGVLVLKRQLIEETQSPKNWIRDLKKLALIKRSFENLVVSAREMNFLSNNLQNFF